MADSILDGTKKLCGLDASYTAFDLDIITHINSVFATLNQLGIGPADGFQITDSAATWDDFLKQNKKFNEVKSYMYLRVRMLFDPPTLSYVITAIQEQIQQIEWRLNVVRETTDWIEGYIPSSSTNEVVFDGGAP